MPHRRDAVDVAVRESARRVRPRQFRAVVDAGPPPDLDKMDSAPRFVAENCALKGVDALMKLAMAYIGINRLDGAAECLTCVARACAKPGTEGIERGFEVLGNEECLAL